MLQALARFAIAAPKRVIAAALLMMVAAGVFAIPVMDSLSAGGMRNSTSQSWYASKILADKFDQGDMQLIVSVSSDAGAQGVSARKVATDLVAQLERFPFVTQVQSAWTAPPPMARSMLSEDGRTGLIIAGITGGESGAQKNGRELLPLFHDRNGVTVTPGGEVMTYIEANDQSKRDLLTMEALGLPVSFVVLVWVFGGMLAAAVPLAVGIFAIVGSMAILRAVAAFTEVSIFSLNLALVMGLALAIDYTLLIVSRFRDEIADGAERDDALVRTMATAGRTVLFSALTVSLSMATMALFPMYFLKSLAYAGVAVVALAAVAAVVVTPAAIAVLGTRLDALDMRRFGRRREGQPASAASSAREAALAPGRGRPPWHRDRARPSRDPTLKVVTIAGHRLRPAGHGHPAQPRDQPAPPRRSHQHRQGGATSRLRLPPDHSNYSRSYDFAEALKPPRSSAPSRRPARLSPPLGRSF